MKKRILLITSEFPPQPGGIGNHAYHLAQSLVENEYAVTVLVDARTNDGELESTFDGSLPYAVHRLKRRNLLLVTYLLRFWYGVKLSFKTDVILCSGKFSLWIGGCIALFSNKKTIAIIHGSEVKLPHKGSKWLTDFCLKKIDRVVAVSNYTASLVRSLQLKNLEVIPNGFSIDAVATFPKQIGSLQLITVGNVTERKGQQNVIKALPALLAHFPQLTYHIVGIPTQKEKLFSLAASLGVQDKVVFYGSVSEKEKIGLLQKATIFVMLSEQTPQGDVEGFGIAILEANALGLPAIGAKGCGIEDAINERVSGRLVSLDNTEELIESLKDILNNYEHYSQRAVGWATHFTWDQIIKKYRLIIEEYV